VHRAVKTNISEDVWLSGVFGGKSVSLDCITGQSERSRADLRHFQASSEDLLLHVILDVSHVQRIRDFFGNTLYSVLPLYSVYAALLLPNCRKLEFRLSALMDSDLARVNGKSGRQS